MKPLLAALMLAPALTGCLAVTGGVETFQYRIEPEFVASIPADAIEPALSPTEARYVRDTARTVFRRRAAERTVGFVPSEAGAFALCLRSGGDVALLVFERRVFEEAISQAADDARILRGRAETAPCRTSGRRWVAV